MLKNYEITVNVKVESGTQTFACVAESEEDALDKLQSGQCEIIDESLEVSDVDDSSAEVIESRDISTRLPSDKMYLLLDAIEKIHKEAGKIGEPPRREDMLKDYAHEANSSLDEIFAITDLIVGDGS